MIKNNSLGIKNAYSRKILKMIKLISILFILSPVSSYGSITYSQSTVLSIEVRLETVKNVIKTIESKSEYIFLYNDMTLDTSRKVSINVKDQTIDKILDVLFAGTDNIYKISDRQIFISKKADEPKVGQKGNDKSITIEGMVISSTDNKPVAGVSVVIEGSTIGIQTDANGEYKLKIPATTKQVTFSYIGFDTKKIDVANSYLFKLVTMIEKVNELNDVVVVGFGTQKKESLVGAVQAVKPSQLVLTSSNLTTSFAGNIAGVIASQSSGEPGYDGATFYIRGMSTFGSNKSPLIVLDGVEIVNAMLNNIPPETIESFSILKDATATALYGSRGANGVIIVTTKSGHDSEKMKVNVRFENTFSMPTRVQKIANGVTYMEAYNEAVKNSIPVGETYTPYYSDDKIEGTRNQLNPYIFPDNDWYGMLFKDFTVNQNLNFNMTGGTKKIDYFLSATFFNENGIVKKPADSRYDTDINNQKFLFQSNVSALVTKTTKVALKMNTQLWYNNRPYEDISNLFYYTMRANPMRFPATLPAEPGDTYVRYGNNTSWDAGPNDLNPYALLSRGYGNRYYSYLTTAITVDQDLNFITKGLSAKVLASFYNYTYSASYRYFTPFYFKVKDDYSTNEDGSYKYNTESIGDPGNTYLSSSAAREGHREYSLQGSVDYSRKFEKHDVGAMLVYHIKEKVLNAGEVIENNILPFREQGFAGRVTYNYDRRYLVEFNFGYNGSENFIVGKRFGFFPSVAVGYSVSNETFFEPLKKVISQLKLRGSYGESGNDALASRFPYLTTVKMGNSLSFYKGMNFNGTSGPDIESLGNENATWEIAKKLNLGMDIGFFNSLNLSIDYFHEDRSGIFMQRMSLPTSMGLAGSTPYANIGRVKNGGVDLSLEYNKAVNKDLIVTLRGTFTYAHNEVVAKDEPKLLYPYTSALGHPINTIYGLISDGLFASEEDIVQSPRQEFSDYKVGDIKYRDLNGDGKIDGNDKTAIGFPTVPEIIYGFGGTVKYHKWDLTLFFQGVGNVSLRMYNMHPFADASHFGYNITQYIADNHWSESNPDVNAAYPRLSSTLNVNNNQVSSFWVKNATYLRLKNAEIGYTATKFLRFYVAGSNLLSFSPFDNWDPEMGSGNGLKYPLQRTVKAGLQFQF